MSNSGVRTDAVRPSPRPKTAAGTAASTASLGDSTKKERIWVAVRIRPLQELEQLAHERVAWKAANDTTLEFVDEERGSQFSGTYQYDRVFPETSTSYEVYAAATQSLVHASMQGYNSAIFAYGQTGSGKTYTMQAIMTEAAKHVFQHIKHSLSHQFIVRVSAVEIYNEVLRDLLRENSPALKVVDDPQKGTVAEGLTEVGVQSVQHLDQLLQEVETRRQTRATRMNDNSSRSHEIVRLYIESRPARSLSSAHSSHSEDDLQQDARSEPSSSQAVMPVTSASINFVDLAGSERAQQAAVLDDADKERLRQKEASNINKSLLTLGAVIRALGETMGRKHIPYRDSKLTRLLQSSLSGNSHMAIITNISPAAGSADSTRAALHFANAAKRVVMRPKLNEVTNEKAVIRTMLAEIALLKDKLEAASKPNELHTALKEKEEQVKSTAEERDQLREKLRHLQKQILHGDSARAKRHGSWSTDGPWWHNRATLAKELRSSGIAQTSAAADDAAPGRDTNPGEQVASSGQVSKSMRLLDCYLTPGAKSNPAAALSSQQMPVLQQAAAPVAAAGPSTHRQQPAQQGSGLQDQQARSQGHVGPVEAYRAAQMQKLQAPVGPEAEAAMAGLQVEVRCYKHGQEYTLAELTAALEHLECKQAAGQGLGSWSQDQLEALKVEVARQQAAEALTALGDKALDALSRKMSSYHSSAEESQFGELRQQLMDTVALTQATSSKLPDAAWHSLPLTGQGLAAAGRQLSDESPSPLLFASQAEGLESGSWPEREPDLMPGETTPQPTQRPTAGPHSKAEEDAEQAGGHDSGGGSSNSSGSGKSQRAAAELARLQEAFRESIEKDVSCLREVLAQYKEHIERLEMQKKLLLNQVLRLEFALEEEDAAKQKLARQLQRTQAERDAARADARAAAGSAGALQGSSSQPHLPALAVPTNRQLSIFDADQDSWASTPTVQTLLPKIVALWEELFVPLVYRSRFFLAFRGREVFYYEVEHRRLEWKRSAMMKGENADVDPNQPYDVYTAGAERAGSSVGPLTASLTMASRRRSRELDKAARALDWERKSLAAQLKWNLTEGEREELFREWDVDVDKKERKLQLVFKLWSPETVRQPTGMQRSSELIVSLCGMDASEHMMELVFGDFEREYSTTGSLKPSSSSLGFAVSSVVRKIAPPLPRASSGRGPRPPSRAAGSFTSRIHSGFMSLLSSREQAARGRGGEMSNSFTSTASAGISRQEAA